jgi:hypothetical protein
LNQMSNVNLDIVIQFIKDKELDKKCRKREKAYMRHYLIYKLYSTNLYGWSEIGKIFNRNHATMIHSKKQHEALKKDKLYLYMIREAADLFDDAVLQYIPEPRDIYIDLQKANNLDGLRRIKRWIKEGLYELKTEKL